MFRPSGSIVLPFWIKNKKASLTLRIESPYPSHPALQPRPELRAVWSCKKTTGGKSDHGIDLVKPLSTSQLFTLVKTIVASYADSLQARYARGRLRDERMH